MPIATREQVTHSEPELLPGLWARVPGCSAGNESLALQSWPERTYCRWGLAPFGSFLFQDLELCGLDFIQPNLQRGLLWRQSSILASSCCFELGPETKSHLLFAVVETNFDAAEVDSTPKVGPTAVVGDESEVVRSFSG